MAAKEADWLTGHVELVGLPSPTKLRPPGADASREEVLLQVAATSERFREEVEQHRKELQRRWAYSSPDLSTSLQRVPSRKGWLRWCPPCLAAPCLTLAQLSSLAFDRPRHRGPQGPAPEVGTGAFDDPERALIIFDWDDTLCPTTYIMQALESAAAVGRDSPHYEELYVHAHLVGFVLRQARRIARVAIVTNSLNPWVLSSGARYLPGLHLDRLLLELDIPVYYSRAHLEELTTTYLETKFRISLNHRPGDRVGIDVVPSMQDGTLKITKIEPDGLVDKWNKENPDQAVLPGDIMLRVNGQSQKLAQECRKLQVLDIEMARAIPDRDPLLEAKRIDMATAVEHFYPDQTWRKNVISIGDSTTERNAVKEVLKAANQDTTPICKTVNLLEHPSLQTLGSELRILCVWLSRMVKYPKDFDMAMDNLDTLEKELFYDPFFTYDDK